MTSTHDALFSAVYAAPDDDAPRHALAEALRAVRDPRGESSGFSSARAGGGDIAKVDR